MQLLRHVRIGFTLQNRRWPPGLNLPNVNMLALPLRACQHADFKDLDRTALPDVRPHGGTGVADYSEPAVYRRLPSATKGDVIQTKAGKASLSPWCQSALTAINSFVLLSVSTGLSFPTAPFIFKLSSHRFARPARLRNCTY